MVRLPSAFKLSVLQILGDKVDLGEFPSILQAVKSYQSSGFTSVKDGQTILSCSGGGYSSTFSVPGTYNPQEIFGLWGELRIVYTYALATLTNAGFPEPTPEQIVATMAASDEFQSVTRSHGDYSQLRAGGCL